MQSARCYRTNLAPDRRRGLAITGALQPLASATSQCVWAADLHFVGHPGGTGPRLAVKAHACRAGAVDDAAFGFLQVALHCLHMAPRVGETQRRSNLWQQTSRPRQWLRSLYMIIECDRSQRQADAQQHGAQFVLLRTLMISQVLITCCRTAAATSGVPSALDDPPLTPITGTSMHRQLCSSKRLGRRLEVMCSRARL